MLYFYFVRHVLFTYPLTVYALLAANAYLPHLPPPSASARCPIICPTFRTPATFIIPPQLRAPSACLHVRLSACLSARVSVCAHLSIRTCMLLSACSSRRHMCAFICMCMCVCASFRLSSTCFPPCDIHTYTPIRYYCCWRSLDGRVRDAPQCDVLTYGYR